MKAFAWLIAYGLLACNGFAQNTVQEWQAKAVKFYPELGIQGSPFHAAYVKLYKELQQTRPEYFHTHPTGLGNEAGSL